MNASLALHRFCNLFPVNNLYHFILTVGFKGLWSRISANYNQMLARTWSKLVRNWHMPKSGACSGKGKEMRLHQARLHLPHHHLPRPVPLMKTCFWRGRRKKIENWKLLISHQMQMKKKKIAEKIHWDSLTPLHLTNLSWKTGLRFCYNKLLFPKSIIYFSWIPIQNQLLTNQFFKFIFKSVYFQINFYLNQLMLSNYYS